MTTNATFDPCFAGFLIDDYDDFDLHVTPAEREVLETRAALFFNPDPDINMLPLDLCIEDEQPPPLNPVASNLHIPLPLGPPLEWEKFYQLVNNSTVSRADDMIAQENHSWKETQHQLQDENDQMPGLNPQINTQPLHVNQQLTYDGANKATQSFQVPQMLSFDGSNKATDNLKVPQQNLIDVVILQDHMEQLPPESNMLDVIQQLNPEQLDKQGIMEYIQRNCLSTKESRGMQQSSITLMKDGNDAPYFLPTMTPNGQLKDLQVILDSGTDIDQAQDIRHLEQFTNVSQNGLQGPLLSFDGSNKATDNLKVPQQNLIDVVILQDHMEQLPPESNMLDVIQQLNPEQLDKQYWYLDRGRSFKNVGSAEPTGKDLQTSQLRKRGIQDIDSSLREPGEISSAMAIRKALKATILNKRRKRGMEDILTDKNLPKLQEPLTKEEMEKTRRRQEGNRLAAMRYRRNQKKKDQTLEESVEGTQSSQRRLQSEKEALMVEKKALIKQCHAHQHCQSWTEDASAELEKLTIGGDGTGDMVG